MAGFLFCSHSNVKIRLYSGIYFGFCAHGRGIWCGTDDRWQYPRSNAGRVRTNLRLCRVTGVCPSSLAIGGDGLIFILCSFDCIHLSKQKRSGGAAR